MKNTISAWYPSFTKLLAETHSQSADLSQACSTAHHILQPSPDQKRHGIHPILHYPIVNSCVHRYGPDEGEIKSRVDTRRRIKSIAMCVCASMRRKGEQTASTPEVSTALFFWTETTDRKYTSRRVQDALFREREGWASTRRSHRLPQTQSATYSPPTNQKPPTHRSGYHYSTAASPCSSARHRQSSG